MTNNGFYLITSLEQQNSFFLFDYIISKAKTALSRDDKWFLFGLEQHDNSFVSIQLDD